MVELSRLGIAFGLGLFMSAPTVADVIIDSHSSSVFSSSLVATGTGFNPAGPVFDVLDLGSQERIDLQTFSLQLDELAVTNIQNDTGQDLSSTVDTSQSFAVQRSASEVSFIGSASTSIATVLGDPVFSPAGDVLSSSELYLDFSLTVPYLIDIDFSWTGSPQLNRVDNFQEFILFGSRISNVRLRSDPDNAGLADLVPGTFTYQALLPAGNYELDYYAQSANQAANSEARTRDISFNTNGAFSARFTQPAQPVPEPAGLALMLLAMGSLLKRRRLQSTR